MGCRPNRRDQPPSESLEESLVSLVTDAEVPGEVLGSAGAVVSVVGVREGEGGLLLGSGAGGEVVAGVCGGVHGGVHAGVEVVGPGVQVEEVGGVHTGVVEVETAGDAGCWDWEVVLGGVQAGVDAPVVADGDGVVVDDVELLDERGDEDEESLLVELTGEVKVAEGGGAGGDWPTPRAATEAPAAKRPAVTRAAISVAFMLGSPHEG
ncbi:hypothetical protein FB557_1279 [Marihabitans asiaticum]|uniref:Uncharacterized protein n=1 Tax=Marihabitans asiaticum TaxID=415218 RepID=A0A560WE00_9MICO|nr:hypothetical protein FB557_1279 [Marihabitans asiaticum]